MDQVHKYDTLMSQTYQLEYKPSGCKINPYALVIEHKLRPRLEEVHLRNRYRRSLSQLLNSKRTDDTFDKNRSFKDKLHKFESRLQGKISKAAPIKDHQ